jgi:CRISPR-associated protein Cas2
MPASRKTPWLICYDIADPRRLQRVHAIACRHAVPFQYSLFCREATRKEIAMILDTLAEAIDPRHDDLRAYPLLTGVPQRHYGRGRLPEGVLFAR